MRHVVEYQLDGDGFLPKAIVEADVAERADATAFVEEVFGVTPQRLVESHLILFPGVLHLSIQDENNTPAQTDDFLLAWENNGHRNRIVALRRGQVITVDDRIIITPVASVPMTGEKGYTGASRDICLAVNVNNGGFVANLELDLRQTTRNFEHKKPIFTYADSCSDHTPYGKSGQIGIQLLGKTFFQDVRTTFHEAAIVAMDALTSASDYADMPLAA